MTSQFRHIKVDQLENLLLKNWANFLDSRELINFTLKCVRDNINSLKKIQEESLPERGVQITLSKFELTPNGFLLWIDFTVPNKNSLSLGTIEAILTYDNLIMKQILGNYLYLNNV